MKRTYYLVEGEQTPFTTLKEIRLWLYGQSLENRWHYDTLKIYYCVIHIGQLCPMREIHVHPITGEVWFSKVV